MSDFCVIRFTSPTRLNTNLAQAAGQGMFSFHLFFPERARGFLAQLGRSCFLLALIMLTAWISACSAPDGPTQVKQGTQEAPGSAQRVFDQVARSVVTVQVYTTHYSLRGESLADLESITERNDKPVSIGSGVVISPTEIVTNWHVISPGEHTEIVTFDGKHATASGAIVDIERDLCILTIEGVQLDAVHTRSARSMRVGEPVFSVGSPSGLSQSLAQGLVSGLRAESDTFVIQTTAAISPGSSGGGLFDGAGNLVGITTYKVRDSEQLGFALPSDWIMEIRARNAALIQQDASARLKYEKACESASRRRAFCTNEPDLQTCKHKVEPVFGREDPSAGTAWTKASPYSPAAWACAAEAHEDAYDYAEAATAIERAVELRPLPSTLVDAGRIFRSLGSHLQVSDTGAANAASNRGLEYLLRATRADPKSDDAWAELARTHQVLGNSLQAQAAVDTALALNPNNSLASVVLRMIELGI